MDDLQKRTDDELKDIMRNSLSNQHVTSSIYHRAKQELEFRNEEATRQGKDLTPTAKAVLHSAHTSKMDTDVTGKFITIDMLEYQFSEKRMPMVREAIRQLIDQDLLEQVEDSDEVFRLTPFGAIYPIEQHPAPVSYSNISNSNIAHQSQGVTQTIDINSLPEDIQRSIEELRSAAKKRDPSAMKRAFGYIADKAVDVAIAIAIGHLKL